MRLPKQYHTDPHITLPVFPTSEGGTGRGSGRTPALTRGTVRRVCGRKEVRLSLGHESESSARRRHPRLSDLGTRNESSTVTGGSGDSAEGHGTGPGVPGSPDWGGEERVVTDVGSHRTDVQPVGGDHVSLMRTYFLDDRRTADGTPCRRGREGPYGRVGGCIGV